VAEWSQPVSREPGLRLVLIASAVLQSATRTEGGRERVVYPMRDSRYGLKVSEHRRQVRVGLPTVPLPWHAVVNLACADHSGAHHRDEQRFVIVGNAARVRRDVDGRTTRCQRGR